MEISQLEAEVILKKVGNNFASMETQIMVHISQQTLIEQETLAVETLIQRLGK